MDKHSLCLLSKNKKMNLKTPPQQSKQSRFLTALTNRLRQMDDPNPEVITHDSYHYHETTLKGIGTIPKITFTPYGQSTKIKAEILRKSNLGNESRQQEIAQIRAKFGLKTARDTQNRILARLFESYWTNYWRSIRTALARIEQAQKLFITTSDKGETISEPMKILMGNVVLSTEEKEKPNQNKKEKKSYMDELMEVE